jgi:lysophospholipase L1-like esterase
MIKIILFAILTTVSLPVVSQSMKEKIRFLALGDSYTIGESVDEQHRWPVLLANALRERGFEVDHPTIIATTGWRTDQLKHAIETAKLSKPYTLVSLLIGVNNQYQGKSAERYAPEFEELLQIAIELAGGDKSKVFVVSIPDYGYTPFGKDKQASISKGIDAFNEVNEKLTRKAGVTYVNITDISRHGFEDPALVADDGLHPSGKMYALWVERILKALRF